MDRLCSICGREIQGGSERVDGALACWGCARLARWRINHPGEPDPWWADDSLPIPERLKLEPLREYAFKRARSRKLWTR